MQEQLQDREQNSQHMVIFIENKIARQKVYLVWQYYLVRVTALFFRLTVLLKGIPRQTAVCRGTSTLTLRIEPSRQETERSFLSSLYRLAYKLFITKKDGLYHNTNAIASAPA